MIIKLSDYMLEQAVSDAEVSDIFVEQAVAEIEVGAALANAYAKQLMMEQYIMEADETETKTEEPAETESGEKKSFGDKVKGFFAAIGKAIIGFFRLIGEKLKDFWDWITRKSKKTEEALEKAAESEETAEILVEKFEVNDNDVLSALGINNETLTDKASAQLKAPVICQIFDVQAIRDFLTRVSGVKQVRLLAERVNEVCKSNMNNTAAIGKAVKELEPVLTNYVKDVSDPIVKEGRPKGVSAQQAVKNMQEFINTVNKGTYDGIIKNSISECNLLTDIFNNIFNTIGGKYKKNGDLVSENGYNGAVYQPLMRVTKMIQDTAIDVKKKLHAIPSVCGSITNALAKYESDKRAKDKLREQTFGKPHNKSDESKSDNNKAVESSTGKNRENESKSGSYTGGYEAPKFV